MFGNDYDTTDGTGNGEDRVVVVHGWNCALFFWIYCSYIAVIVQKHVITSAILLLGVRDYIHVVDLAKGHIAALKKLKEDCGCKVGIRKEGTKSKHFRTHVLVHCAFTMVEVFTGALACVFIVSAGLQPRNGERLLCAPDDKSDGEGIGEGGE